MFKQKKVLLYLEAIIGMAPLIIVCFVASYILLGFLLLIIFSGGIDMLNPRMLFALIELFLIATGLVGFFSLMKKNQTEEVPTFSLNKIRIFLAMLLLGIILLFIGLMPKVLEGDFEYWQISLVTLLPLCVAGHFIYMEKEYIFSS